MNEFVQGVTQLNELKKTFIEALITLLEHEPLEAITVKEIVGASKKSRATFYNTFANKEALVRQMRQHIYTQFLAYYYERGNDVPTVAICRHILTYRHFYKDTFSDTEQVHELSEMLIPIMKKAYDDDGYAIFASYGTVGFLMNWVQQGFLMSPTEAAEKLFYIAATDWSKRTNLNHLFDRNNKPV